MLYDVKSPINRANNRMTEASNTYAKLMKDIPANRDPGPTAGGAMMSGMGGAGVGAQIVSMSGKGGATGGYWGAAAGAVVGIGSYLLS